MGYDLSPSGLGGEQFTPFPSLHFHPRMEIPVYWSGKERSK
jgi:hypothetical protein